MRKILLAIACAALLLFALAGCGESEVETTGNPPGTSDEMWSDFKSNAKLDVHKEGGRVLTVEYGYDIPELADEPALVEGGYYRVTADVTFLNGGVAGYVDFPQIERIISIEEIPPVEASQ